jgi:ATP-dependent Clp protease adapter protein ClpS
VGRHCVEGSRDDKNLCLAVCRISRYDCSVECVEICMAIIRDNEPAFSQSLDQSLRRALAIAEERRHQFVTEGHLLLALTDDPDAAAVMRACKVDLEQLRRTVSASLSILDESQLASGTTPQSSSSCQLIVQRAVIHMQSIRGDHVITGAHVLAQVFAEHAAAELLSEQGMTRYDATSYISHGIAKGDRVLHGRVGEEGPGRQAVSDKPPGLLAEVRLLNDDYTPMEFVVHVLERVFDKDRETAERIMFEIHNDGVGTCGIYPYDTADAKVTEVLDFARKHQHPLQCVLERLA